MHWIPSLLEEPPAMEGHPEQEMEQPVLWKYLSLSLLIDHVPGEPQTN